MTSIEMDWTDQFEDSTSLNENEQEEQDKQQEEKPPNKEQMNMKLLTFSTPIIIPRTNSQLMKKLTIPRTPNHTPATNPIINNFLADNVNSKNNSKDIETSILMRLNDLPDNIRNSYTNQELIQRLLLINYNQELFQRSPLCLRLITCSDNCDGTHC